MELSRETICFVRSRVIFFHPFILNGETNTLDYDRGTNDDNRCLAAHKKCDQ